MRARTRRGASVAKMAHFNTRTPEFYVIEIVYQKESQQRKEKTKKESKNSWLTSCHVLASNFLSLIRFRLLAVLIQLSRNAFETINLSDLVAECTAPVFMFSDQMSVHQFPSNTVSHYTKFMPMLSTHTHTNSTTCQFSRSPSFYDPIENDNSIHAEYGDHLARRRAIWQW